ncbi:MAG: hypothetical protein MUD12_15740 [Spirochaetes bacterium]|jgi:hypothetical protein|nr:hypothetical protein [Spirochaetota bacterium]
MKNICIFVMSVIVCFCSSLGYGADADKSVVENASAQTNYGKFIPDISLIIDFGYLYRNMDNGSFRNTVIPGTVYSSRALLDRSIYFPEQGAGHENGNSAVRGFNFNYGELALSSAVDPYFDLFAIFHLQRDGFEVEEAYATTSSLPLGLQVKAGKFLSSFGRINEQHGHVWSFFDRPLISMLIFGDEGLNELGARLTWLAPLDFYLLFGGEVLNGENEQSFGREGLKVLDAYTLVREQSGPALYTGYMKTSFDAGGWVFLAGASFARGETRKEYSVNEAQMTGFISAATMVFGGDLTAKYMFDSYRYIAIQGEYIWSVSKGRRYSAALDLDLTHLFTVIESPGCLLEQHVRRINSGLYAQLVAHFARMWGAGVRYDVLLQTGLKKYGRLPRYSAMIEFTPTEFSRLRLQYNHDRSLVRQYNEMYSSRRINNEVILEATMAIGAHAAHSF